MLFCSIHFAESLFQTHSGEFVKVKYADNKRRVLCKNIINGLPIAAVILLLAVGFAFLVKGADFLWRSSSIAKS